MNKDKKMLFGVSSSFVALLLLALLLPGGQSRIAAACLTTAFAAAVLFLFKKRKPASIHARQVLWLMAVMAAVSVMLLYLSGLPFGFVRAGGGEVLTALLPTVALIVCSELVRTRLLQQESKTAAVLGYLACVLAEVMLSGSFCVVTTFHRFMDFVGLALFPALCAGVLYHYVAKRYGATPNIVYRLLLTLYPYLLPALPATPDSLLAFLKMGLPMLALGFLFVLYEKRDKTKQHRRRYLYNAATVCLLLVMVAGVLLISCEFRYGAIVIGSESMTGEINKGDVVIYEQYSDQTVEVGEVILFIKDNRTTVHRVIDVKCIDGINLYYTKGDANEDPDTGYITDSDIIGVTSFKIAYIGYPTIWVRNIFQY